MARSAGALSSARRVLYVLRTLTGPARVRLLKRLVETDRSRSLRLQRVRESLPTCGRLVYVCHGNIMRSAFATAVTRQRFPHAADRVIGAGTHAKAGRPAQDSALRVAASLHAPLDSHAATPLEGAALGEDDVIVCMDLFNEANVLAACPHLADRVFRVGDVNADMSHAMREVRDPYGGGDSVTAEAFARVQRLAEQWGALLIP